MAWFAASDIKARFNFSLKDDTDDSPISFAGENAANDLEDWLSPEDFAMAMDSSEPINAAILKRYKRILNAHAFLTVYYVFLTNTQIRSGGSVKSEQDGDVKIVNYYLPKELMEMRGQYLAQAKNLIAAFSIAGFTEEIETAGGGEICASHPADYTSECLLN